MVGRRARGAMDMASTAFFGITGTAAFVTALIAIAVAYAI